MQFVFRDYYSGGSFTETQSVKGHFNVCLFSILALVFSFLLLQSFTVGEYEKLQRKQ